MWEVLRKETTVQSGRTALRTDVADAMKRLSGRETSTGASLRGPLAP
jgi:hypothetical protein